MKKSSYHILRIGLAITFLWIGILILKSPMDWAGYIQPWAKNLMPFSLGGAIISAAILDLLVGFFLLTDYLTWLAAFFGTFHLLIVLIVSGINAITIRDIGLLAAMLSLFATSLPSLLESRSVEKGA